MWPVGSSSRGKAWVEAFGPDPGSTGIPVLPVSAGAEGAVPTAGAVTFPEPVLGNSGIGFSDGVGVSAGGVVD